MLILASNSPRRAQLLTLTGWDFSVLVAEVDEQAIPGESAEGYVRRIASNKALAVYELMGSTAGSGEVIIAADTAVIDFAYAQTTQSVLRGGSNKRDEILGKPANAQEAWEMLWRLRGRTHHVYTGLAVMHVRDAELVGDVDITEVRMRNYGDEELQAYIESGDPLDKAGAYAIQHPGFQPVEGLKGCYANVMGLPVCRLTRVLERFGILPVSDVVKDCQEAKERPCQIYNQVLG